MKAKTKLVTYDDYRSLPDDGKRYEIIGGELLMTPSPNTEHQRISRKLLAQIDTYVGQKKLGEIFSAPIDVVFSMTDVLQPDLVFVAKKRLHIITKNNIVEAPDLVIEILSESTATVDQNSKKTLYEKFGVKEYWIVDPEEKQIEQYILKDESFQMKNSFEKSDSLTSDVLSNFRIELEKVF